MVPRWAICPWRRARSLRPRGAVLVEGQRRGRLGLGRLEEGGKLGEVHAELAVIVVLAATEPASAIAGGPFAHRARRRRVAGVPRSARCR